MNRLNLKAYVTAIQGAVLSDRKSLQVQLAVAFAVMLESPGNKKLIRAQLCEIYAGAGYACREPSDVHWKSINRRITAAMLLFEFNSEKEVREWAGDGKPATAIEGIIKKLEPLKLKTFNEVIQICREGKGGRPGAGRKPGVKLETAHLRCIVPQSASPEEMLELAGKLMAMAQGMMTERQEHEEELLAA